MNPHTIWQSECFKLSQSYDFRLPGYMFVECISNPRSLADLQPSESQELVSVLKLAEHLLHTLIRPEKVYVLKFGESDDRVHFHIIPRTTKLLASYLNACQTSPPYNGALITAWLWANAESLGYTEEDISDFVSSARQACGELTRRSTLLLSVAGHCAIKPRNAG